MSRTAFRSLVAALFIFAVAVSGCSDDVVIFEATCTGCVNGIPVGPAANRAACEEFALQFDCLVADLFFEGSCEQPNVATCAVTDCEFEPMCPPVQ